MTEFEQWSLIVQVAGVIVAGVALFGLWRYVKHTKALAGDTKLLADRTEELAKDSFEERRMRSKVTVSFKCSAIPELGSVPSVISVSFVNHSMLHAKIKSEITLISINEETKETSIHNEGPPYNGAEWTLTAQKTHTGIVTVQDPQFFAVGNVVMLSVKVYSCEYEFGAEFEANPIETYTWYRTTKQWVPVN